MDQEEAGVASESEKSQTWEEESKGICVYLIDPHVFHVLLFSIFFITENKQALSYQRGLCEVTEDGGN